MAQRRTDGSPPRVTAGRGSQRTRGPLIRLGRAANDNWPGIAAWLRTVAAIAAAAALGAYLLGLWG